LLCRVGNDDAQKETVEDRDRRSGIPYCAACSSGGTPDSKPHS